MHHLFIFQEQKICISRNRSTSPGIPLVKLCITFFFLLMIALITSLTNQTGFHYYNRLLSLPSIVYHHISSLISVSSYLIISFIVKKYITESKSEETFENFQPPPTTSQPPPCKQAHTGPTTAELFRRRFSFWRCQITGRRGCRRSCFTMGDLEESSAEQPQPILLEGIFVGGLRKPEIRRSTTS